MYKAAAVILFVLMIGVMVFCIKMDTKSVNDYPENPTGITLWINEVLYANLGFIRDEDGDNSDWIELYNYGDKSLNLEGLSLSDQMGKMGRWYFPDMELAPGEYLIVWASGKNKVTDSGELHTDFLINPSDIITLYDKNDECIDRFHFEESVETGLSVGRNVKNPGQLAILSANTPNRANNASIVSSVARIDSTLSEPVFSADGGVYDDSFELKLSCNEGESILYTLDGSEPSLDSSVYSGPILIKDRSDEPNTIANTKTSANYLMEYSWENNYTYKGTVVRARTVKNGVLSDKVVTKTYFVNPSATFDIVALTVDPEDMFDEWNGLYVPGKSYYIWKKYNKESTNTAFPPGNYSLDDKVGCHIEVFSKEGELMADGNGQTKIMGAYSRHIPEKSLKVMLDTNGGLDTGVFNLLPIKDSEEAGTLDSFVLRNSGTDFYHTMFADSLAQNIVSSAMNVTTQAAEPSVVFINGEYWGIHNIREVFNADYFFRHYKIEQRNLVYIDLNTALYDPEINEGTPEDLQDYYDLVEYVNTHDLSNPECYSYVCDRVDVESFMDYYIAEIYYGNTDWPGNNFRIWRADQSGTEYGDTKWRPVLYDLDEAFRYENYNTLEAVLTKDYDKEKLDDNRSRGYDDNREIIEALMKNDEFNARFFERFDECLDTVFSSENVLEKIDAYEKLYSPEMDDHYLRWHTTDGWLTTIKVKLGKGHTEKGVYSVENWEKTVEEFKTFAKERPGNIRKYIELYKQG